MIPAALTFFFSGGTGSFHQRGAVSTGSGAEFSGNPERLVLKTHQNTTEELPRQRDSPEEPGGGVLQLLRLKGNP